MPFTVTGGIDFLVESLRHRISDYKYTHSTVVGENSGTSNGTLPEFFYTDNMPVLEGYDTHLRIDRWYYTKVDSEAEAAGQRSYVFILESGAFKIPTGAIPATSGERSEIGYTWLEEQEAQFSDSELKMYLASAITEVNTMYDFGFRFEMPTITGAYITPFIGPSDIGAYFYLHYATFLIKKGLEAEGFNDRIYVRDITTTIDTSKGLGDLVKSSKDLLDQFNSLLNELKLKGQEAVFTRLDNYSTYPGTFIGQQYESNYDEDSDFF